MRNWLFFSFLFICVTVFPVRLWAQAAPKIFFNPVKLEKKDGAYILSGSLQKDKHKETDPVPLSTISISASFYTYPKEEGAAPVLILPAIGYRKDSDITDSEKLILLNNEVPPKGLFESGNYFFIINSSQLNSNTLYNIVISFKNTSGATAEGIFRATTEKGVIPGTEESFINERSYRLLAPIPGMTLLLDPELCQAEQQVGKAGQICDINAFINFLLSLAIGAAAVVLVVRIIISGYSYMTTDIPFLKAKTKGQFVEALVGLLVALSSYLILNTISPRLVSNDLKIGAVSFDVEEMLAISAAHYDTASAKTLTAEEIKKIKTQYGKNWEGSIKSVYIPAQNSAVPTASKGIKTLMTAQTSYEGFIVPGENSQYPNGSKSFRSNNPGNLGTDWTKTGSYPNLDAGIKAQYDYINRVVTGKHKAYPLGKHLTQPATTLAGHSYPAIDFNPYTGTLRQYLNIYDAGTRLNNSYLTFIISFFAKSGYTITPETTLSQIAAMN